jgi:hypothetical protein
MMAHILHCLAELHARSRRVSVLPYENVTYRDWKEIN